MSGRGNHVLMRLDGARVLAARVSADGGVVRVHEWASMRMPDELDRGDADAVGRWLAGSMEEYGIGRAPVVFGLGRSEVVLKRLSLPRGSDLTTADVVGMVRLQMVRQVTFEVEGAAIDYLPLRAGDGEEEEVRPLTVLAGALPGERLAWIRGVVKSAGLRLGRVTLLASGAASVLEGVSARHSGPVLGVSVSWEGVEFVVVENGELVFARSADLSLGEGEEGEFARRVGVEAKRTWMSFRVAREGAEVEACYVLASNGLGSKVAGACGAALEMPSQTISSPAEAAGAIAEGDRLSFQPLLGLAGWREDLDFAHPRRAPDVSAKRRQVALAGVLGAIAVVGGGIVWARLDLAALEDEVSSAAAQETNLREQYYAHEREHARLRHIEEWKAGAVDWFAHLNRLSERMPDTRLALLDEIRANSNETRVEFRPRDGRYDGGTWRASPRASLTLVGSVKSREVANELRGRLLAEKGYSVTSTGPDTETRFVFGVTTSRVSPEPAEGNP